MSDSEPKAAPPALAPNLAAAVRRAVGHLVAGGLVIAPTESAYGIFVLANRPKALARLRALKGRPAGQPLPLVVADLVALARVALPPSDAQSRVMQYLWPGPLTLVLPARDDVPEEVTGATGTVGVRISPHPVTATLCQLAGPLTATSANLSGGPLVRHVAELDPALLADDVLVVDGGFCPESPPSTVARIDADGTVTILREGPVSETQIRAVLGDPGDPGDGIPLSPRTGPRRR